MPDELRLAPDQLEALASMIADKLAVARVEVIDAVELAHRLGTSRDFVYANRERLGAMRLSDRPQGHIVFKWPDALEGLSARSGSERSQTPDPVPSAPTRRRRRRSLGTSTDLLPIAPTNGRKS